MDRDRPVIGITADVEADRFCLARAYVRLVEHAGGVPIVLPAVPGCVEEIVALCDGFVLSGGDDPDTAQWGVPIHPAARPIDVDRQAFEIALLARIEAEDRPVLGVCLGMQMMALHAGGAIDQHLPDTLPTAAEHWGRKEHVVAGALGEGVVHSHHRQAVSDPGPLAVVARAPDGVIEAVRDGTRQFYLGVQWHPERTSETELGPDLIAGLVAAATRT